MAVTKHKALFTAESSGKAYIRSVLCWMNGGMKATEHQQHADPDLTPDITRNVFTGSSTHVSCECIVA